MNNNDFATHLSAYFLKYMPTRTGYSSNTIKSYKTPESTTILCHLRYSSNTIKSYRDAFIILLRYSKAVLRIKPEKLDFKLINRNMIEDFLSWLECQKRYSVSTRNLRLAALHAFFRYVQLESPEYMELCCSILAIKSKKTSYWNKLSIN